MLKEVYILVNSSFIKELFNIERDGIFFKFEIIIWLLYINWIEWFLSCKIVENVNFRSKVFFDE